MSTSNKINADKFNSKKKILRGAENLHLDS